MVVTPGPDDRPAATADDGDGKIPFLRPETRRDGQLRSPVEDQGGIREIDAMLREIRAAFGFVLFEHETVYMKCIYIVEAGRKPAAEGNRRLHDSSASSPGKNAWQD